MEFEADGEGETLTFGGDEYSLQQMHAHVPSEHTVNGQPDPQLLTSLDDDDRGRTVRAWLEESRVQVSGVGAGRTSTATALLDGTAAAA